MQLTESPLVSSEGVDTNRRRAVIIGAGPAGLTAALELLRRTGVIPVVLEKSHAMGGISRTVNYKGNRMDIGGHRFFSKSDRVMNWWLDILPLNPPAKRPTSSATRIRAGNWPPAPLPSIPRKPTA